jgi:hypothetical protein
MYAKSSLITIVVLIVGGFAAGALGKHVPLPEIDVRIRSEIPVNVGRGALPSGSEVVMVFVGTPSCVYCRRPETTELVRKVAAKLRATAAAEDAGLVSVGVAPDWIPAQGWRFLHRILNFDEVVVGRNLMNSELVELVWSDPRAVIGTPQIMVYRQTVVPPSPSGFVRAAIRREPPTVRVTGLEEIRSWVEAGCPLDWGA